MILVRWSWYYLSSLFMFKHYLMTFLTVVIANVIFSPFAALHTNEKHHLVKKPLVFVNVVNAFYEIIKRQNLETLFCEYFVIECLWLLYYIIELIKINIFHYPWPLKNSISIITRFRLKHKFIIILYVPVVFVRPSVSYQFTRK